MVHDAEKPDAKSVADVPPFAFIGKFASGKGLYADELIRSLKSEFHIEVYKVPSFSAKIKEVAAELFDEGLANDRTVWQRLGNMMRQIDRQVWAKVLIRKIAGEKATAFVVEGFRDPEELRAFRDRFPEMLVIRIDTDPGKRMEVYKKRYGSYPTKEQIEHDTEKAIDTMDADIALFNDYTKDTLKRQLDGIVSALKAGSMDELLIHKNNSKG
ncbi:MAG: hypothetical protein KGI00_05090 [Candidatus Micrarchaeota archaeon]|nr:hypothetical protein [Candidatus Micrarchaeota archaeon]MDE1850074.1 hypothetical protein [Candidatus Micrarchaeota archaeon]